MRRTLTAVATLCLVGLAPAPGAEPAPTPPAGARDPAPAAPPARLADLPAVAAAFLEAHPDNVWRLESLLKEEWAAMDPAARVHLADPSGQGRLELFAPVSLESDRPRGPNRRLAAVLRVHRDERWRAELIALPADHGGEPDGDVTGESSQETPVLDLSLHWAGDLTGDGRAELLYSWVVFGANTAFQTVAAVGLRDGAWRPIFRAEQIAGEVRVATGLPGPPSTPGSDTRPPRIVLERGQVGGAGAGPQRDERREYAWQGEGMDLVHRELGCAPHPLFLLADAELSLLAGRPTAAEAFYREVLHLVREPGGQDGSFYRDFAALRLMVRAALAGHPEAMSRIAGSLQEPHPLLRPAVEAFRRAFAEHADPARACRTARDAWAAAGPQGLAPPPPGHQSPTLTADSLCPEVLGFTIEDGDRELAAKTTFTCQPTTWPPDAG